jgi:integrase/recombinase XerC
MTTQSLSRIIKTAFRNAGYDSDRLTAHSLRHTAITAVVKSTKDVTIAQQFAGHSNVETTMTYYHANEIEANPSAEIVNNLFFNTEKAD